MTYIKHIKRAVGFIGLGFLLVACAPEQQSTLESGYHYATAETQAMQDDDIDNPSFFWIDIAQGLYPKVDGEAGKSCADCHGENAAGLKGAATSYPKYSERDGKLSTVEDEINNCRTSRMKAKAWKWESDEMLGMTAFVKLQSRGLPINVSVSGKTAPFYEKGKEFYNERRGGLDLSCKNCHTDYPGMYLRANVLTNGLPNGFPLYRLKWQKIGSLHRRFRGCNTNVRAEPFDQGSDEYTNLELYITAKANGVLLETPAVRN